MVPVVLHHGLFGHGGSHFGPVKFSYFRGIDRALAGDGRPVLLTHVHPSSTIAVRAGQLVKSLVGRLTEAGLSGRRVILMAHSMGGLDARYALARLGLGDHVAALVTVTTPHRGSPFADWVIRHLGRRLGGLALCDALGLDFNGIGDLTTERCGEFNDRVGDVPGVLYSSVAAARPWSRIAPFALPAYRVVRAAEGDNDGLVSVKSAAWGTNCGTWPADHWHTINHRFLPEQKPRTGDIAPYWRRLLQDTLARLGEP